MNENRINSIKIAFEGIGPDKTTMYTNQEIVDKLIDIQTVMKKGVYEKTHAEYMRDRDLMIHFASLATEYGLLDTEVYKRFEENMRDLSYTIGSFIKGMKGERIARKALKLITYDNNVKILYNIALEDNDDKAEYDAIVITPYGLFVVEVKNWGTEMHIDESGILRRCDQGIKYDLASRMSVKESLLRGCLAELFPDIYQGVLLFSYDNANVKDEYKKIPLSYGGGIVYCIRDFNSGEEILSIEQIEKIVDRISSNHKEQKAVCKVDCEAIIDDYATLMATIEETAEGTYSSVEELKFVEKMESDVKNFNDDKKHDTKEQTIIDIISGVASALVIFGLGAVTAKTITSCK